ncbi:hypothetical protein OIU76_000381 [Salix suchowensis]|nr:hypothetical protein OIU76_000381 [Salix suchowensis]
MVGREIMKIKVVTSELMPRKAIQQSLPYFFQGMVREGACFAPSQFQAGFTGLAHTAEDIQKTIAAAEKALPQIQSFFVPVYVF